MLPIVKNTLLPDEVAIIESLPKVDRDYVMLRTEQPYSAYSIINQKSFCTDVVRRCYNYCGQNGADFIEIQSKELFEQISGRYATLTLSEISKAFKDGLDGLYGPYFGICGKTYTLFLKSFFEDNKRQKAWLEYQNLLNMPRSEKPLVFSKSQLREMILKDFKAFKESGDMPVSSGACAVYYEEIKEHLGVKSLIPLDKWEEIKTQGIEAYRNQRKEHLKTIDSLVKIYGTMIYQGEIKRVALRAYWSSIDELKI